MNESERIAVLEAALVKARASLVEVLDRTGCEYAIADLNASIAQIDAAIAK